MKLMGGYKFMGLFKKKRRTDPVKRGFTAALRGQSQGVFTEKAARRHTGRKKIDHFWEGGGLQTRKAFQLEKRRRKASLRSSKGA